MPNYLTHYKTATDIASYGYSYLVCTICGAKIDTGYQYQHDQFHYGISALQVPVIQHVPPSVPITYEDGIPKPKPRPLPKLRRIKNNAKAKADASN